MPNRDHDASRRMEPSLVAGGLDEISMFDHGYIQLGALLVEVPEGGKELSVGRSHALGCAEATVAENVRLHDACRYPGRHVRMPKIHRILVAEHTRTSCSAGYGR